MNIYNSTLYDPLLSTEPKIITTNYSLVNSDTNKLIQCSGSSALTITITGSFSPGINVSFLRYTSSSVSFTSGSGVILRTALGNSIRARYDVATALHIGNNEWILLGGLM